MPEQRFVIDHIAKPVIMARPDPMWAADMRALAQRPNVFCKLSGLSTLPRLGGAAVEPYLDLVLAAFGAARCMVGSDWPVSTLGGDYGQTIGLLRQWAAALSADEQAQLMGGSCTAFYRL